MRSLSPRSLLRAVEARAVPEAAALGRSLAAGHAVSDFFEHAGPTAVRLEGWVVPAEGTRLRVSVNAEESGVAAVCECGDSDCAHVLALLRHWVRLRGKQSPGGASRWRTLLDRVAPRKGHRSPEPGETAFVHWVDLVRTSGYGWDLVLRWRVHRPKGDGLGRGRRVAPANALRGEVPGMGGLDRRVIEAALGADNTPSFTPPFAPFPDAAAVPPDRAETVLKALSQALYVYWEGTRERAAFDPVPALPQFSVEAAGEKLLLRGGWRLADGRPWEAENIRVLRGGSPWAEAGGIFRPVFGAADGESLAALLEEGAAVPASESAAFLGTAIPALEAWGARVELAPELGMDGMRFGEHPRPRLYLEEEEGELVARLAFAYGDFEVSAEMPDPVLFFGSGSSRTALKRDMDEEFAAVRKLRGLGLRPGEPGRFAVDGDRALDFVASDLPRLAREWEVFGQDRLRRHRVRSRPLSLSVHIAAGIDWLDLHMEGRTEGQTADAEEILRVLRRKGRYVRLGDGSHALLPEAWLQRLAPAAPALGPHGRVRPWLGGAVAAFAEAADEVVIEGEDRWHRLLEALRSAEGEEAAELPEGLTCRLRPYQERGYRWLRFLEARGLGGVLADDMGLGKTVQTLALLLSERKAGRPGPNLVVAPTSVVPNWEDEIRRHAPSLTFVRHHGAERAANLATLADRDVVVTSYAVLRRDIEELRAVSWNYVILDEAQAIKNASTQTARAAQKLDARRRLALTGTPLENHLGELWSQFRFLMPELLGSERAFTAQFVRPIAQGDAEAAEALRRRIRPFILRRMKPEVAPDLPPRVDNVLWSEFLPDQERLYRSLLAAGRERVFREVEAKGFAKARATVLSALLRLRQVCCHPAVLPGGLGEGIGSAKFDQFCEFVSEVIEEGHRVLVYSQFVEVLTILRRWFEERGISHLYLDGRTRDREGRVRRFQEDPSVAAFLVSLQARGGPASI